MHCRAYLLLEREYKSLQKNPEWGIEVVPSENKVFCWYATISGLVGTIWEDGCFHLTLHFSELYDEEPPLIKFNTIPFHPNIDPITGEPCVDFFDSRAGSSAELSVRSILVNIQALFSNPSLDNPVNAEAADLLKASPHIYNQLVKSCVTESRNLIEILKNQDLETISAENEGKIEFFGQNKPLPSSSSSLSRRPKQVSFDEYRRYWTDIASSQPLATISLLQPFAFDSGLNLTSYGWQDRGTPRRASPFPRNESMTPSASKAVVMDTEQKMTKLRQKKLERISAMKQLYLNKNEEKDTPGSTAPVSSLTDMAANNKTTEMWDKEAEDLVAWTTSLPGETS